MTGTLKIKNISKLSSKLFEHLTDINWLGTYGTSEQVRSGGSSSSSLHSSDHEVNLNVFTSYEEKTKSMVDTNAYLSTSPTISPIIKPKALIRKSELIVVTSPNSTSKSRSRSKSKTRTNALL